MANHKRCLNSVIRTVYDIHIMPTKPSNLGWLKIQCHFTYNDHGVYTDNK